METEKLLELLYLGNKAAASAMALYDRATRGEMTADEALAEWKDNAAKVQSEGARFDELTG